MAIVPRLEPRLDLEVRWSSAEQLIFPAIERIA